jgi:peroxiredoxin
MMTRLFFQKKAVLSWLLLAWGLMAFCSSPTADGYQIGQVVKNFTLKSTEGKTVSLSDYTAQKGVIVVFTANQCPFSRAYEERLNALHKKWAAEGYPVVAINPNDPNTNEEDSMEQMRERAKAVGYAFPYLADPTQEVAQAFGAKRTPQAFVLQNTSGKFTLVYQGAVDNNPQDASAATRHHVEEVLLSLERNRTIETTTTRAIGCAIKWREL